MKGKAGYFKLALCPFCGGEPKFNKQLGYLNWQIHCECCMCVTAPESTKQEVADIWNRRYFEIMAINSK